VAIGDITGDDHADLVVGANDNNRVWVYAGSSLTNPFFLTGPNNSGFGYGLAIGNLAGSTSPYLGLLAITGRNAATGYIYGGPATSTSVASSVIQPAALTFPLASLELGDINGDGVADILIGSPNIFCTGTAYLYRSGASGYQSRFLWARLRAEIRSFTDRVPPWWREPKLCLSATCPRRSTVSLTPARLTFTCYRKRSISARGTRRSRRNSAPQMTSSD
jgi:hypothetical protein